MISPTRSCRLFPLLSRPRRAWIFGLGILLSPELWGLAQQIPPGSAPLAKMEATGSSLMPGAVVARDIDLGNTHEYVLPLAARTYLFLEILPVGVEIDASLLDPEGKPVAAADGRAGFGILRLLALVTSTPGSYRLRVTTHGKHAFSGHYELEARALRPAEAGDKIRVEAVRRLAEGRRLRGDAESREKALTKLKEALSLWESVKDAPGEVESLAEIGGLYADHGEHQEAMRWHQKALQRAQESRYAKGESWALCNLGNCYLEMAQYDNSIKLYKSAITSWEQIGRISEKAFALQGLGKAYRTKGAPGEALNAFKEALSLQEKARDFAGQAHALSGIGAIYYDQGNITEALKVWEQALGFSRAVGDTNGEAILDLDLGSIYYRRGQFQRSVETLTSLVERIDPKDAGHAFYNLGGIYLDLGDLDKALENYQSALAAARQAKKINEQISSLVGIGTTLQRQGNPRAALKQYDEARKLLPEESWMIPHYVGLAQLALEEPGQALQSFQRALKVARATQQRTSEASTLLAMGTAYHALGELDRAAEYFGQAIQLGNDTEYPSVVTPSLLRRAKLRRDQGRLEEARADIEAALDIIESTRRNIAGQQIRLGYSASKQTYYEFYIDLLMQLDQLHPDGEYRYLALEASERARSRGLLDLLAEGRINVNDGLDSELKEKESKLADDFARAQTELGMSPTPKRAQELRERLDQLHGDQEKLDWEVRRRNRRYAQVRYPTPLKAREIQQQDLGDGAALLEYALGEARSTLFVVTREKISSYPLPAGRIILEQVQRLRAALEKENLLTWPEYLDSAFRLYQMLVAPAIGDLAGKSSLVIVPDRGLYYIPFEAFLTEAPGKGASSPMPYLLYKYAIAYVPSASVLANLREPRAVSPADSKELIAFAPFSGSGERAGIRGTAGGGEIQAKSIPRKFPPLPASGREISGIADLYQGSALEFFRNEATEETVKRNPAVATAHRLHFATHAQLDERYPEDSSLVLVRPEGSPEDGYLRVQEIFNLKLAADLVVLSACQTGRGKEVTGEGLIGLTRAFFYAGAPSLVVSLWNVTDSSTPGLMLDFYKNLDHLHDKAQALKAAKVSMIERGVYKHPSYWAPFILIGEPR